MLYEAAAGRKPFEAASAIALALAIEQGEVTPLAQVRPDVDGAMTATVERAMAPDPARRFGSANEMAAALGLTLAGDTTLEQLVPLDPSPTMVASAPLMSAAAARPGFGWRRWRSIGWRPAALAAVVLMAALALLAVGGDDGAGNGVTPARAEPAPAPTTATTREPAPTTTVRLAPPDPEFQIRADVGGRDQDRDAKPGKGAGKERKEDRDD
jgi:serine/threonine-protein kinase